MAEKKVIEIEIKDNSKSLKAQYKEAVLEVQRLADAFGETSVEVANAAKKAAELKDKIEDVNDAIQAQKGEGAFIALGKSVSAVASGFSAVQGAMGLVGVESEEVQQAMLRVQSAMALAQGLEGLEDAGRAFKQLGAVVKSTTVFTSAYNFVVYGTTKATTAQTIATGIQTGATTGATTATKLLRLAMLSLPILAIVAGLVALAGAMGVFGDKTEDAEAKQKRLDAQLEKTNKQIENQKKSTDSLNEIIDKQTRIDLINAKNRGASESELIRIQENGSKRRIKVLEEEAKKSEKLYLKMSKTGSTAQFEAAEKSMLESQKALSDARLSLQESQADRQYKTITENAKKTKKEIDKIGMSNEDLDAMLAESLRKLSEPIILPTPEFTDEPIDLSIVDEATHEINNYWAELELGATKSFEGYKTLLHARMEEELRVTQATGAEADAIRKKYGDLETARANQIQQQKVDLALKYAQTFSQAMSSLNNLLNVNDEERLKNVKQGSKEEDAIKRKMFDRDKKMRIMQTVIDTASNVVTSVRNGGGIPTGIPFGVAAATMGALQIAAIAKTSYGGGSSPVAPPATGGVVAPNLNVVGDTGINQLATLQQQPVKAYVVSNDVTSAQQFDMKVQQTAQI